MPELPEVENIRKGLEKLRGQKILRVFVLQPQTVSGKGNIRKSSSRKTEEFINELRGEIVKGVDRRGKNLLLRMKSGKIVLAHLKMTGQFIFDSSKQAEPAKHTRIIFELSGGTLFFNDARRFGYVIYFPNKHSLNDSGHFKQLGVEPLQRKFTPRFLREAFAGRKMRLKPLLMGQGVVAGLGNIYVDEVCYRAGVLPVRSVETLTAAELHKVHRAIKEVLREAIKAKGSSTKNYRLVSGESGKFAEMHRVYGRAGKPCYACKTVLAKTVIGSRTTVFCAVCQK